MSQQHPSEVIRRMMEELDSAPARTYRPAAVKTILNHVFQVTKNLPDPPDKSQRAEAEDATGCRAPIAAQTLRRGDVFIAATIGGKVRPWVVLRVIGDEVAAMPLSSSETRLTPSQCRFWPGSYLGGTIATFPKETALREITRPYTARRHLAEVERAFFARLAPRKPRRRATLIALRKATG